MPTALTVNPRAKAWRSAHSACRDTDDHNRLVAVMEAGWAPEEFSEYARSCHRRPNKDAATPHAYRQALHCHHNATAMLWRALYRERGSQALPPRPPEALKSSLGECGLQESSRYWPFHSEELIADIDKRARDYFKVSAHSPLHPNAWSASFHHRRREETDELLGPIKPRKKRKPRPPLPEHFNRDWPGHTDAFRLEVEERARDELTRRGLSKHTPITDGFWRFICHRDHQPEES